MIKNYVIGNSRRKVWSKKKFTKAKATSIARGINSGVKQMNVPYPKVVIKKVKK